MSLPNIGNRFPSFISIKFSATRLYKKSPVYLYSISLKALKSSNFAQIVEYEFRNPKIQTIITFLFSPEPIQLLTFPVKLVSSSFSGRSFALFSMSQLPPLCSSDALDRLFHISKTSYIHRVGCTLFINFCTLCLLICGLLEYHACCFRFSSRPLCWCRCKLYKKSYK